MNGIENELDRKNQSACATILTFYMGQSSPSVHDFYAILYAEEIRDNFRDTSRDTLEICYDKLKRSRH